MEGIYIMYSYIVLIRQWLELSIYMFGAFEISYFVFYLLCGGHYSINVERLACN